MKIILFYLSYFINYLFITLPNEQRRNESVSYELRIHRPKLGKKAQETNHI